MTGREGATARVLHASRVPGAAELVSGWSLLGHQRETKNCLRKIQARTVADDSVDQHIEGVSEQWSSHWETSAMRPDESLRGRLLRRYLGSRGGLAGTRYIVSIVRRHFGSFDGKRVLDAGAGTGLLSLELAKRGAHITLLDVAPEALAIARTHFEDRGQRAAFVEGSIFELPFPDASFDLVWNTGVVEHFHADERRRAIAEMLRVVKPEGVVVTINPSASGKIYRFAKKRAERRGTWDVGFETPIETLSGDIDSSQYSIEETREGWFMQLAFFKYLLPSRLRLPYAVTHELVQNVFNVTNRLPGYLLTSVIRHR
jgi:ubiquinone/menaquinone biosynthesis C-methylase UbiE